MKQKVTKKKGAIVTGGRRGGKTTALMVRKKTAPARRAELVPMMPAPVTDHGLTDEIALGALGMVELKLTVREEAILARPVDRADVMIKPTGEPYLSHPSYTRLFNEAFGRLGWAIRPAARPMRSEKQVVCPYILSVHGLPVAFAMGEQDYHETNKNQSYGDALESTFASALRRCAKRLGVGLELWDRRWLNEFIDAECVMVWKDDGKTAWRRKNDPPFYNERKGNHRPQGAPVQTMSEPDPGYTEVRSTGRVPSTGYTRGDGEMLITDKVKDKNDPKSKGGQRQRLYYISELHKRDHKDVKAWLLKRYGYESSKHIKRKHYDEICAAIEAPGPLPTGTLREPGEED